eukprot:10578_1
MKHLVSCVVGLFCLLMFQAQDGYSSNFGANDHKYDDSDDDYDIGDDPVFVGIPEYVHEQPPHIRFAPATQSSTAPNWKCDVCTFANSGVDKNCAMCSASKPVPPHVRQARAAQSSTASSWDCTRCTLKNHGVNKNCEVCGASKPGNNDDREDCPPPPPQQEILAQECSCGLVDCGRCPQCSRTPEPKPGPFKTGGAKFGAATTHSWPCQTCTFENSGFDATCLICDTPKVSVDDYKSLQNQSKDLNTQIEELTDEIKLVDEANLMGVTRDELMKIFESEAEMAVARNVRHNDESSAAKLNEVAKDILRKTDRSLNVTDVIDTLGNFIKDKKNQKIKRIAILRRLETEFHIKRGTAITMNRKLQTIIDDMNKIEGLGTSDVSPAAPPPVYQRTETVVRGLARAAQRDLWDEEYKLTAMFAGNVDKVIDETTQKVTNGFVKDIYEEVSRDKGRLPLYETANKESQKGYGDYYPLDEGIAHLTAQYIDKLKE